MEKLLQNVGERDTVRNSLAYAIGWLENEKKTYSSRDIVGLLETLLELASREDEERLYHVEKKESQAVAAAQDQR